MPAKILIVDDEPFNIDYLEQELDDLGYHTLSATNGKQALELTALEQPDMILLDVMMPHMDGFAVLEHLKADQATRDIPVVIISALHELANVAKAIAMGAEDFLPKPFDTILLKARLSNGLEKKRLRDAEQKYLQALERELTIGRDIQAEFLPRALPAVAGWEIAAHFKAAREVAGDFYDAFWLEDIRRLAVLLGDVCDKGVGAALYMTLFRTLLRASIGGDYFAPPGNARPAIPDDERLLHSVNLTANYVASLHGHTSMYASVFYGLVNPHDGVLTYINCGHQPPLVFNAGGEITARLIRNGPPIGAVPGAAYTAQRLQLSQGDSLLVLTDGITDAINENEEPFGEKRLASLLTKSAGRPAAELLNAVERALQAHMASTPQYDDITLIAVSRRT